MSHNQQIGVNKIAKMMKDDCKRVGLAITGHRLRQINITTLVNDPAVNIKESLAFARHTPVATQRPYMMRDARSEMNQFKAQGLVSDALEGGDEA
jgi:hypothetical protein